MCIRDSLRANDGSLLTVTDKITVGNAVDTEEEVVFVPEPTEGCALAVGFAYKAPNSKSVYMVTKAYKADGSIDETKACAKRAFINERTFLSYFSNFDNVIVDSKITGIPKDELGFMPWGPNYDPQYGALGKVVNDSRVYLLLGDKKYWITSEEVFLGLGYSWNWIEDLSDELLAKYAVGEEIDYTDRHPNYTLVKYENDAKVYRLEPNGSGATVKRHVANEGAFKALGYRWDRIVTIPETEQYPDGELLTTLQ